MVQKISLNDNIWMLLFLSKIFRYSFYALINRKKTISFCNIINVYSLFAWKIFHIAYKIIIIRSTLISSAFCYFYNKKFFNISNHELHSCECSQIRNYYLYTLQITKHKINKYTYLIWEELEQERERESKKSYGYSFLASLQCRAIFDTISKK